MKTSAIAATLFEPATAQTTRSTSASAGSAADFSKMIASVRSQGMAFTARDGSHLVSTPAERPVAQRQAEPGRAEASRATAARDDRPAKPRDAAAEPARDDEPVVTAPTNDTTGTEFTTDDTATQTAAQDASSQDDEPAATDAVTMPIVADTGIPEPTTPQAATIAAAPAALTMTATPAADTAGDGAAEAAAPGTTDPAAMPAAEVVPAADAALAAARQQAEQTSRGAEAAAHGQRQQQQLQQNALAAADAAATALDGAATLDAANVLKAAAAAAAGADAAGSSTTAPLPGQQAELASLASGAGLVIKTNGDRPSTLPPSQLVSGAVMAQSAEGEIAAAAASENGDAAGQFLANGEARTALANALDNAATATRATDAVLATKPFAAAVAEAAANTNTNTARATATTAQPIAGLGAMGTTATAAPTGIAQAASHAHGPQLSTPVQQVSGALATAAAKGQDSISIQLSPDDLGRIDIQLDFSGDKVSAVIAAEKPETLEMLQKDSRTLERMLGEAGLQTDQQSLSFSLRGQQNQQNAAREERSSRSRAQLLALDDAAPTPAIQSRARTTVGGLDISV